MDDTKLPDLRELRDGLKRKFKLPPQTSAHDTSNWDNRYFSAPSLSTEREFHFHLPPTEEIPPNPYLEQERVKADIRNKKKRK